MCYFTVQFGPHGPFNLNTKITQEEYHQFCNANPRLRGDRIYGKSTHCPTSVEEANDIIGPSQDSMCEDKGINALQRLSRPGMTNQNLKE